MQNKEYLDVRKKCLNFVMNSIAAICIIFSASCSSVELEALIIQSKDLHSSIKTKHFNRKSIRHVPFDILQSNPQYSEDIKFINAITRSSSQGKLDGENIRSGLYALYEAGPDLGFYGLEATTSQYAEEFEEKLRKIWSHNISIRRASVYRKDAVLVVVWHDGVASDVWDAVN